MTDKETQASAGVASKLNAELDVFTTIPTETGLYLNREVIDGVPDDWHSVIITKKGDELIVFDNDVGEYPLDIYHHNLISVQWKKLKICKQESIDVSRHLAESIRGNNYNDMPLIEA